MAELNDILPPTIYQRLEKANINTINQLLVLSNWDIKKLTNLGNDDTMLLKNIVSSKICPEIVTADNLLHKDYHVNTGCTKINEALGGGYRKGTITELFGESASGKTQLGLQAALYNWHCGCVYICTEDKFPIKRFQQVTKHIDNYDPRIDYGQHIFIEYITESQDLLACVKLKLPKLLDSQKTISLIIIDSVAAPYRCESTNYIQRAEDLRELAVSLIELAQKYGLAVLCINQATASFNDLVDVLPALGLAWSNLISARLYLRKTQDKIKSNHFTFENGAQSSYDVRELSVIFSPDLPQSNVRFVIDSKGVTAS